MGWFFKSTKKIAGKLFNFRVDQWVDYATIKTVANYIVRQSKNLFLSYKLSENHITAEESFEEARQRLNLTDEALKVQAMQYKRLALFFVALSCCIFCYFLFLTFIQRNYMGACMSFALTLYGLSQAMRYHFWYFQIRQKKLGCTLKEWSLALLPIKKDAK